MHERRRGICFLQLYFPLRTVHDNISYLEWLKDHISPDCIVTDVGSVKGEIHQAVEKLGLDDHFIGGHPMAGSEKPVLKMPLIC